MDKDDRRAKHHERARRSFAKPRDPARIGRILTKLDEAWRRHAEMRLAQILVVLSTTQPNPLFDLDDDVLERRLDQFLETGVWPRSDDPDE